jgi:hypothetical protein
LWSKHQGKFKNIFLYFNFEDDRKNVKAFSNMFPLSKEPKARWLAHHGILPDQRNWRRGAWHGVICTVMDIPYRLL